MWLSIATLDKREELQLRKNKILKNRSASAASGAVNSISNSNNLTDLTANIYNSTSSNETVIERLDTQKAPLGLAGGDLERTPEVEEEDGEEEDDHLNRTNKSSRTLKSIIINFGHHLNLFNHNQQQQQQTHNARSRRTSDNSGHNNFLVSLAQRCFHLKFSPQGATSSSGGLPSDCVRECHSCPVTPLKDGINCESSADQQPKRTQSAHHQQANGAPSHEHSQHQHHRHRKSTGKKRGSHLRVGSTPQPASLPQLAECETPKKPSVRFVVESPAREELPAPAPAPADVAAVDCAKDGSAHCIADNKELESLCANKTTTTTTTTTNCNGKMSKSERRNVNSKQRYFTINKHLKFNSRHARQVKFTDCAVQTGSGEQQQPSEFIENDAERAKFVEQLFSMAHVEQSEQCEPATQLQELTDKLQLPDVEENRKQNEKLTQKPMDSGQFRAYGYRLIDYICNYLDTIRQRRVTPINIEPGYLKSLIQPAAPEQGESFPKIMRDFEEHIMCGITHWQHPHFHAYFPAGNAYPSILADMLSDALGCVGFSWAASPAYTELEIIMLDWMGKMIGLPDEFLCLSSSSGSGGVGAAGPDEGRVSLDADIANSATSGNKSRGGGVIQGSASECVLVNMLAARHWAMDKLRKRHPGVQDGILLTKLIGYCSKEAHSCVEKAAMIGFINMRALETDERHSLRGETLRRALEADLAAGLEPFIVCATLGTTSCVSFDNLKELGAVCRDHDNLWLHVDAAYAGSALICPEFKYLIEGIELATSFNMNPNKWMLINFDCSLMWVKDRFKLTRAFVVDPLYLQHSFSDQAIDYRHWGIPLSRRFRALKLWFTIRNYGLEGLREYIRNHVQLAKLFESLIRQDKRFIITNEVILGLVCFRLIGSNALNQRLLSMLNASGKLHMVPASLNGRYIIRFCVCDQNARAEDIHYAYECIAQMASELFELIKAGKERIRAISQQNTIDVSSISLHTQQSASADLVGPTNEAGSAGAHNQQVAGCQGEGARSMHQHHSLGRVESTRTVRTSQELDASVTSTWTNQLGGNSANRLLTKQVSIRDSDRGAQTERRPMSSEEEDLGQEVPIDDAINLDNEIYDDDLSVTDDDDNDDDEQLDAEILEGLDEDSMLAEEALGQDERRPANLHSDGSTQALGQTHEEQARMREQLRSIINDSISPIQRGRLSRASGSVRSNSTLRSQVNYHQAQTQDEADEAADELVKLADKRNRMSLRYKREFFVRVVSDPRVYRASISGDINAHAASTSSLGSSGGGIGGVTNLKSAAVATGEQAAESNENENEKKKKKKSE